MPQPFLNPYNFIPTPPRRREDPQLGDRAPAGHHRWHEDRYSGRLTVRLTTVTPLLIPDGGREERNGHKVFGIRTGADGRPLLPPTSVKGMLRAAYEAITNSRFGVFAGHEERLAYRAPSTSAIALVPCRIVEGTIAGEKRLAARLLHGESPIGGNGRPSSPDPALMYAAWLPRYGVGPRLPRDKAEAEKALRHPDGMLPAHGERVWVQVEERTHRSNRFRYLRVSRIRRDAPPAGEKGWQEGWVCITGANIRNKHDERVFLIGKETAKAIVLDDSHQRQWSELVGNYQDIHRDEIAQRRQQGLSPSDYLGDEPGRTAFSRHVYTDTDRTLKAGTLCYAAVEKTGDAQTPWRIKALYPVSISRALLATAPEALLDPSLQPARSLDELSPADRVFGWVHPGGHGQFKGQLRIGPVHCEQDGAAAIQRFDGKGVPLAILGSPKPQQGRFYTSPDPQSCKPHPDRTPKNDTYRSGQALRGRKVYLHHAHLQALGEPQQAAYWQDTGGQATPAGRLDGGREVFREWLQLGQDEARRSNQNRSVTAWVKPGAAFTFDIEVGNLGATELGALLWLLQLPADAHHRLGGGKPLGFGSVRLELTGHRICRGDALRQRYAALDAEAATLDDAQLKALKEQFERLDGTRQQRQAFEAAARGWKNLPVHYPRTSPRPDPSGQSFQWFVENDRIAQGGLAHGLALPALTPDKAPALPILDGGNAGGGPRGGGGGGDRGRGGPGPASGHRGGGDGGRAGTGGRGPGGHGRR